MKRPALSLRWLDVFCAAARAGSIKAAAEQSGLSISTASQHIKALETALGTELFDHGRRPMILTANGASFLRHAEEALGVLDQGQAELVDATPATLGHLRFAMIEDFDSDIGPEVTRLLASALPQSRITHYTRVSHEILDLLASRQLDLGVATQPSQAIPGVATYPLLRDPFVLAVPANSTQSGEDFIQGESGLALLRYNRGLIMGSLVEAQLNRLRLKLDNAFELDSTASIMALVAQGHGWTITTPSNYVRARRFQSQIRLLPFPRKEFARTIAIFVGDTKAQGIAKAVSDAMRSLLSEHVINPAIQEYDWLQGRFRLMPDEIDG